MALSLVFSSKFIVSIQDPVLGARCCGLSDAVSATTRPVPLAINMFRKKDGGISVCKKNNVRITECYFDNHYIYSAIAAQLPLVTSGRGFWIRAGGYIFSKAP
jgi:hypothetical protein